MLQIFRKNFALKVFALALATIGWGYFRFANNPVIAARFDQQLSVPITVIRLPAGYVARVPEKEAIVTVASGRRSSPVVPSDIKAVADLENRTDGAYTIPIQVVGPQGLVIQSLSPASVTLRIVKVDQKSFPLALHYQGVQTRVVTANARMTPDRAEVRGASDDLSRVTAVRVDVPLPAAPTTFDAMVRPVAVDSSGSEVSGVQVAPNLIRTQVQFVSGASH